MIPINFVECKRVRQTLDDDDDADDDDEDDNAADDDNSDNVDVADDDADQEKLQNLRTFKFNMSDHKEALVKCCLFSNPALFCLGHWAKSCACCEKIFNLKNSCVLCCFVQRGRFKSFK